MVTPRGPNLLLVTIDTLRADRVPACGYANGQMPFFDRLAREGTVCARTLAPTPVTLPSHTTILTGAFPPAHGVRSNGMFRLADGRHTLAEILQSAGYQTAAFVSAYVLDSRFGLAQGFDLYDDEMPEADPLSRFGFMAERPAEDTCNRLIAWLESAGETGHAATGEDRTPETRTPFFVWLHLFDPHQDYIPPEPYFGLFADQPYDGEIAYTDYQLGRVLATLHRQGMSAETLVAVTADHGQSMGQHGESSHGIFIYECDTAVPLLLWQPDVVAAGRIHLPPVQLADLAPTLLDLIGLNRQSSSWTELMTQIQGESFAAAVLAGGSAGIPATDQARDIYLETYYPRFNYGWHELVAVISGRFKYISAPEPELYDLETDPDEELNLLSGNASTTEISAAELEQRLDALLERYGGAGGEPAVETVDPDEETRRRLLALGYVTPEGPHPAMDSERVLPDPKRMIRYQEELFRAATLTQMGEFSKAAEIYEAVLRQSPDAPNILIKAGFVLQHLGRDIEAETCYRHAVRFHPESEESFYNLGIICLRQGRFNEAIRDLAEAVRLDPDNGLFHLDYGEALFRTDLHEKAAYEFARALALDPGLDRAALNLGLLASRKGEAGPAESWYRQALAINSSSVDALNRLAVLLSATDRAREGETNLRHALTINPDYAETHFNLGACLDSLGRRGESDTAFRRYLELEPNGRHAARARSRIGTAAGPGRSSTTDR